jgi:hypothetical protein
MAIGKVLVKNDDMVFCFYFICIHLSKPKLFDNIELLPIAFLIFEEQDPCNPMPS